MGMFVVDLVSIKWVYFIGAYATAENAAEAAKVALEMMK